MPKYISINEFDTFRFHDAQFKNIEINNNNMIWELEKVNVTQANSQNDCDTDMEAGVLFLTFTNCQVTKIEHYGLKTYDKSGKLIKDEPNRVARVEDYNDILFAIPGDHGWISDIRSSKNQNGYQLSAEILTFEDSLIIDIVYSDVKAEWNTYEKEAWYLEFAKKD